MSHRGLSFLGEEEQREIYFSAVDCLHFLQGYRFKGARAVV